ncbi:MAG: hypothetical protein ACOCRK_02280 [bacterium]
MTIEEKPTRIEFTYRDQLNRNINMVYEENRQGSTVTINGNQKYPVSFFEEVYNFLKKKNIIKDNNSEEENKNNDNDGNDELPIPNITQVGNNSNDNNSNNDNSFVSLQKSSESKDKNDDEKDKQEDTIADNSQDITS